jgi:hypothetical protein
MVHAADSLGEDVADLEDLELRAARFVLCLVHRVGHDHLVEGAGINAIDGISAQDPVGDERIHLGSALLLQQLRRTRDRVRCVCQVIDEDGRAVRDVSDEHHSRILAVVDLGGTALLVDQRKGHAKRIRDSRCALSSAGVRTHNDGLLKVRNVELDVLAEEVATVEVVNGDVEEALILGVCRELARPI